jgi:hypothetical protein
MKQIHGDATPDARMAEAIRAATGRSRSSEAELAALHGRIIHAARPYVDGRVSMRASWLDYAAAWSRTIVPLGLATAVLAASCLVWLSASARRVTPSNVEHVAMLGAATNSVSSGDLIDLAGSDFDVPLSAPAARR